MVSVQIKILTANSNFLALYLQVYASQEAETLAVHSLLTIQNTEIIKRNLKNVRKWQVFAQRVTWCFQYSTDV